MEHRNIDINMNDELLDLRIEIIKFLTLIKT